MDKKTPISIIETIFISANYEDDAHNSDNPNRELCRYEFYETLIRIAKSKFKDSGICRNMPDSLEFLFNDHVLPFMSHIKWDEFRTEKLWTIEVNDIFSANLENLKKIYNYMTYKEAIQLMAKKLPLGLHDHQVTYCYGMSKMTIIDEMRKAKSNTYQRLLFCEFLEFIARCADMLKFKKGIITKISQTNEGMLIYKIYSKLTLPILEKQSSISSEEGKDLSFS